MDASRIANWVLHIGYRSRQHAYVRPVDAGRLACWPIWNSLTRVSANTRTRRFTTLTSRTLSLIAICFLFQLSGFDNSKAQNMPGHQRHAVRVCPSHSNRQRVKHARRVAKTIRALHVASDGRRRFPSLDEPSHSRSRDFVPRIDNPVVTRTAWLARLTALASFRCVVLPRPLLAKPERPATSSRVACLPLRQ